MDAMTRSYIRTQRDAIARASLPPVRKGSGPKAKLQTHEEWVAEVDAAIAEFEKLFDGPQEHVETRLRNLAALSA